MKFSKEDEPVGKVFLLNEFELSLVFLAELTVNEKVEENPTEDNKGPAFVGLSMSNKIFFDKHQIDDHIRKQDPYNTKYNV